MKQKYFKSLMIEPTNICNLNCPVCPTGNAYYDDQLKGKMNFQQFKKIIDLTKDFLEYINLWGFGEPFLAPSIIRMINYAGKNNIMINIHTNGNILNKKMMDNFKKNCKMNITFSIDGLTQKTYSYYRRGGNLKKAMDNLSYLIDFKKKNNLDNLKIIWQFLVMRTNEHEIGKIKQVAKKIGVDKLRLKTIGINKKDQRYDKFIPRNKNYRRIKSKVVNLKSCVFINPGMPTILWNGDVVSCCHDYDKEYYMGNVFKEDLLDIWQGEKYKKFRDDYKKHHNDICNSKCKFTRKSKVYIKEFNFSK